MVNEPKPSDIENNESGNQSPRGDFPDLVREEEGKHTHERIILYLRSLNAPFRRGLALALEALDVAEKETLAVNMEAPVSAGVQALKRLMSDNGLFSSEGPDYGEWFRYRTRCHGPTDGKDLSGGLKSMPPLNRGFMKPEKGV